MLNKTQNRHIFSWKIPKYAKFSHRLCTGLALLGIGLLDIVRKLSKCLGTNVKTEAPPTTSGKTTSENGSEKFKKISICLCICVSVCSEFFTLNSSWTTQDFNMRFSPKVWRHFCLCTFYKFEIFYWRHLTSIGVRKRKNALKSWKIIRSCSNFHSR